MYHRPLSSVLGGDPSAWGFSYLSRMGVMLSLFSKPKDPFCGQHAEFPTRPKPLNPFARATEEQGGSPGSGVEKKNVSLLACPLATNGVGTFRSYFVSTGSLRQLMIELSSDGEDVYEDFIVQYDVGRCA